MPAYVLKGNSSNPAGRLGDRAGRTWLLLSVPRNDDQYLAIRMLENIVLATADAEPALRPKTLDDLPRVGLDIGQLCLADR